MNTIQSIKLNQIFLQSLESRQLLAGTSDSEGGEANEASDCIGGGTGGGLTTCFESAYNTSLPYVESAYNTSLPYVESAYNTSLPYIQATPSWLSEHFGVTGFADTVYNNGLSIQNVVATGISSAVGLGLGITAIKYFGKFSFLTTGVSLAKIGYDYYTQGYGQESLGDYAMAHKADHDVQLVAGSTGGGLMAATIAYVGDKVAAETVRQVELAAIINALEDDSIGLPAQEALVKATQFSAIGSIFKQVSDIPVVGLGLKVLGNVAYIGLKAVHLDANLRMGADIVKGVYDALASDRVTALIYGVKNVDENLLPSARSSQLQLRD